MKRLKFIVQNPVGLYATPINELVDLVKDTPCQVNLKYQQKVVNLKSMMSVLSLGIPAKAPIEIIINGEGESKVRDLIQNKISSL